MEVGCNPAPRLAGMDRAPVSIELHESDGSLFLTVCITNSTLPDPTALHFL